MLQICLLGDLRVLNDDVLINRINTPRLYSLLAYLVLHRDLPQHRRDLAFMLWPDSSEAQARTNLRKLLYQLRQVLPDADAYLHFEGQMVHWQQGHGYVLDVEMFRAAVDAAQQDRGEEQRQLERAAELYRGDLLPGCYDDWIEPERERLRNLFSGVLERLIALNEAKRSYSQALRNARRLLQMDELNESAYRHLMRLYALTGERAGALRVYHSCVTTFLHELAVEPGKETRELYERLLQDSSPKPGLQAADVSPGAAGVLPGMAVRGLPPLVGREQQWQILQQSWQKAAVGRPCCLVISGEAGIGKTRLAEELQGWIHRQGYLTAYARCFEAEGNMTYGPVADWLRSDALRSQLKALDRVWQVEIARVVPELQAEQPDLPPPGALSEDWQRRRLFDALLRAVSQVQPLAIALFLDDLQWCDGQTLSWMHYLLRSALPIRLLLVCTLRVEELTPQHPVAQWLERLRYSGSLEAVELGALSAAETAELAAYVSGQVLDPASAATLFAETEGHPLFVIESVRMADEHVSKRDSRLEDVQLTSPTVQAVIGQRLARLSPAAHDLAGIAATIGRSFSYPVLAKVSAVADEVSLVRSLDELWQRRIIREHGSNAYDFSHDKIREAAYQGMSAARRRILHRQVGEILSAFIDGQGTPGQMLSPGDLVRQVAAHFDRAGLPERAIPYYHQAAEQARRLFANDEALRSYQRALELLQSAHVFNEDLAAQIGEAYGDLLLLMTRRGEARAAFDQAHNILPAAQQIRRAVLVCKIGNTWRDEYHFEESLTIYTRALQTLGEPPAEEGQAAQDWWQCWIQIQTEILNVYYWMNWIEKNDATSSDIARAVERYGSLTQRANLYRILTAIELRRSRYSPSQKALDSIRNSAAAHRQAGSLDDNPSIRFMLGFALILNGALDEAEIELEIVVHQAEQRGDLSLLARSLTYLTLLNRKRGLLGKVIELAGKALKTAESAQMPEYMGAARANLAWAAWRSGDTRRAREHCQAALNLWSQSPGVQAATAPYYGTAIWPLLAIAAAEDDLPRAIDHARDLLQPDRRRMPDALTSALSEVVADWEQGQDVRPGVKQVLALAEELQEF